MLQRLARDRLILYHVAVTDADRVQIHPACTIPPPRSQEIL